MAKEEEETEEVEEPKKKKTTEAGVVQVPTQTAEMVQLEDGTVVSNLQLLAIVYNKVRKIEKAVA